MTETVILRKAREADWQAMLQNVWSREEAARFMFWSLTTEPEAARERMLRTVRFEQEHPYCYLVALEETDEVIGFAGMEPLGDGMWEESGICIGPGFTRRGFGRQVLGALLSIAREQGGTHFRYSCREQNEASKALAASFGFRLIRREENFQSPKGEIYPMLHYELEL